MSSCFARVSPKEAAANSSRMLQCTIKNPISPLLLNPWSAQTVSATRIDHHPATFARLHFVCVPSAVQEKKHLLSSRHLIARLSAVAFHSLGIQYTHSVPKGSQSRCIDSTSRVSMVPSSLFLFFAPTVSPTTRVPLSQPATLAQSIIAAIPPFSRRFLTGCMFQTSVHAAPVILSHSAPVGSCPALFSAPSFPLLLCRFCSFPRMPVVFPFPLAPLLSLAAT